MAKKRKEHETFGDWLRARRTELGLSQTELERRAKVSKQYISNLERNVRQPISGELIKPSVEVVDRLARALGVPIAEARLKAGYAPPETEEGPKDLLERMRVLFHGWEELSEQDKAQMMAAIEVIAESVQRRRQAKRRQS